MLRRIQPTLAAAALAALSAPLDAQCTGADEYDLDKASPGTVGQNYAVSFLNANPFKTALLAFSINTGPVPFSLVDPSDSRLLCAGLEFGSLWLQTSTSFFGGGQFLLPVPNSASLAGAVLNFHSFTVPGGTTVIDEVSNIARGQLGLADRTVALPNTLPANRGYAPGYSLGNGTWMLVGGRDAPTSTIGSRTTDIFDERTMTVTPGPSMAIARSFATVTQLANGDILVAGGVDVNNNVLASCELYSVANNSWSFVAPMRTRRVVHTATRLNDNRVLVVGGTDDVSSATSALSNGLRTCELYNPTTNTWSTTGSVANLRFLPALNTLRDGRVLHSGGYEVDFFLGIPIPDGTKSGCYFYNPSTGNWTTAPSMRTDRAGHGFNTATFSDGRILVSGGLTAGINPANGTTIANAEIYSPSANSWTAVASMSTARGLHTMTLMPNGRVISTGGAGGVLTALVPFSSVQEFNPASNTWRNLPAMSSARVGHTALLGADDVIYLAGGADAAGNILNLLETFRQ